MADIVDNEAKLNDIEVAQDAPVTEALWNKVGASVNYLIDHVNAAEANIVTLQTDVATLQAAPYTRSGKGLGSWTGTNSATSVALTTFGSNIYAIHLYSGSVYTVIEAAGQEVEVPAASGNMMKVVGNTLYQRNTSFPSAGTRPISFYYAVFYAA